MTAPHLIGIGRLGGNDGKGWHHVMIKPEYKAGFAHMADLYLIFEENRVFYVTISDRKQCEKKTWVRFAEDGIAEERKLHREVILALEDEEAEADEDSLIGLDVVYQDTLLGCVVDSFYNGAQEVLVIATALDTELMVPMVEHYLPEAPAAQAVIFLDNMEDLLLASGLKLDKGQLYEYDDET
jgi:ribosomal 30S subunit maturation factor RimM